MIRCEIVEAMDENRKAGGRHMEIGLGGARELDGWMTLVRSVAKSFPGLETQAALEAHRDTVLGFMSCGGAICAKEQDRVVGALLFSKEQHMLCFLAVDPAYRRRHIAEKMVSCMLDLMEPWTEVTVTTWREGASEGSAARAFYKRLGFAEGELREEFGSPVQEFLLKREAIRRECGRMCDFEKDQAASLEEMRTQGTIG